MKLRKKQIREDLRNWKEMKEVLLGVLIILMVSFIFRYLGDKSNIGFVCGVGIAFFVLKYVDFSNSKEIK